MKFVFRNCCTITYKAEIDLTDKVCEELAERLFDYLHAVSEEEITDELISSIYTPDFIRELLIGGEEDIIISSYEKTPVSIRDYLIDYLRDWACYTAQQEAPEDEHITFAVIR